MEEERKEEEKRKKKGEFIDEDEGEFREVRNLKALKSLA